MTRTLGWDVGGAHLKAALAEGDAVLKVWQEPTPLWTDLASLERALGAILARAGEVDRMAATMTGELSDAFTDREDGVGRLTAILRGRLGERLRLYAGPAGLVPAETWQAHVGAIASANWHAAAALVAARMDEALVLDMGSTTTDLVPVAGGALRARGYTDAERLAAHELVYQGHTRTALMAVATHVPFAGATVPIMAEHFATVADVQRVLGTLEEADDQHPAADGGEKTADASRRRLLRMIGRDLADGGTDGGEAAETRLAQAFAEAQVRRLHDAALVVLSRGDLSEDASVVIAGTGRPTLRRLAARLDRGIVDISDLLDCRSDMREAVCRAAPAAALAILAGRD